MWSDGSKPTGWRNVLTAVKQGGWTASLLTESNFHKIISKEIRYLFITTSVAGFLFPLVLTDWPFAAPAPSHRWHLHLSWPKCWGGEGESTQTTILHQELRNESWEHPASFDKSLHQVSLLYNSAFCIFCKNLWINKFHLMYCTHSIGDGLEKNRDGSHAWQIKQQHVKDKKNLQHQSGSFLWLFPLFLCSIMRSFPITKHFCVMWVTHTSLTSLMPVCLCVCGDRYPCQALLPSSGWCFSAALTLRKASCNTVQLSHAWLCLC